MAIYKFKTEEDIDTLSRTIVQTDEVEATTKESEFTLEGKLNQAQSLKDQKVNIDEQIIKLEEEIVEIKTALSIK